MDHRVTPRQASPWGSPSLMALLLVLLALVIQGQDANWDLRNYHLYTPSALLDGRFAGDIAAAQLQTWHNPTLDMPFAWMVRAGVSGWLVSLWLALPAFLAVLFALRLLDVLWPQGRSTLRTTMAGLAAVGGAAVMPSIGTTFNDAFVAAGMMAALWWGVESQGRRGPWVTWLGVGLMAGLCAGLKLTGVLYCVGFIGAASVGGSARGIPVRLAALAVGGGVGALLTAGPWAAYLWHEHGNPLFPYFNEWFRSPDALPHGHKDARFIPHGIDAWLVPFHLLTDSSRFSEGKLSEPRVLLGFVALAMWWVAAWRARRNDGGAYTAAKIVVAFVLISFITWIGLYGIYRYLFALELVFSIAIIGGLSVWASVRYRTAAVTIAAILLIAGANRPGWGRDGFRTPMISVDVPALPDRSLVILAEDKPLAYAVAYLPKAVPAISIQNNFMDPTRCTGLQARAEQRVRQHAGPLFLLREAATAPLPAALGTYGLAAGGTCLPLPTSLGELELCPLARGAVTPTVCAATPADR